MTRLNSSNGVVPPHATISDDDSDDSYYVPSTPFSRRLAQVDPSLYQGNGDDFCTTENLTEASAFVNHQLSIYGFPSNLQFKGTDEKQAVTLVTTLYKILQQHQRHVEYREEMGDNYRRLSSDHEITLSNLASTKARLEKSEREVDILNGRLSLLEDELRAEVEKHKNTREELKACKGNLQYTKSQFVHESRKKEQEINGLRDKVQKAMNERFNKANIGITLLNPTPRKGQSQHLPPQSKSTSAHSGPPAKTENELLLEQVIDQQRDKEVEIVTENGQLRKTLYTVHIELNKFLRKHDMSKDKDKDSSSNIYGLPFEMVKDKIETEIRDQLTSLADQWAHRPAPEPTISPTEILVRDQQIQDLQKEIEKLDLELENSTKLVQGAQTMIDNMSNSQLLNGIQQFKLQLEESEMTGPEIDEAQAKIQQLREDLANERKEFTQACLDLGRQREQLQKDRADFEASKQNFQLEEFLAYLDGNGRRTDNTRERMWDLSLSPPPTTQSQQHQLPKERSVPQAAQRYTTEQSGSVSTKRPAATPADIFQPPAKKPMFSQSPHQTRTRKLYPSRVEDESVAEQVDVRYGALDEGGEGREEEEEEESPLLRTPTRSLGNMDRSLGFREIARNNAAAVAAARANDTGAAKGRERPLPSVASGDDGRSSNSEKSDRLQQLGDLRAVPTIQPLHSREADQIPTKTTFGTSSIFGRRPPTTPFSFRSALSVGGEERQDQQKQVRPVPTVLASMTELGTRSLSAARPTTKETGVASAKQSAETTTHNEPEDRRLSLKSSVRLPPAMSRVASSMAARKQSQRSRDQQTPTTPVDPILMFTAPSVPLSNNRITTRGGGQTFLSTPTTSVDSSNSAIAKATPSSAITASTTATVASSYSPASLPAAQQRQQMYESNRRAFMSARTPK